MKRFYLTSFFILWGSLMVFVPTAHAEGTTLSISPAKYDLKFEEGQPLQTVVKVTNQSAIPLPIKVVAMDFAPQDDNGAVAYDTSMPGRSAKDWFYFDKTDLILSPGESQPVTVTISPPERVTDGSYFAVVMFQATIPTEYLPQAGAHESSVAVVPWIGTLFLMQKGTVALDENALTIRSFSIPKFTTKTNIPVELVVENHTNYHLTPQTNFELKTVFGTVVATADIEQTTVMPGMHRKIKGEIIRKSPFGLYKPTATLKIAGYSKSISGNLLYLLTLAGVAILAVFLAGTGHGVHHTVKHHRKYKHRFRAFWLAIRGKI